MCSSDLRDDIEACTSVDESFGDRDTADRGGADQGDGPHDTGGFGVVGDVEVDLVMRPLERPGGPVLRLVCQLSPSTKLYWIPRRVPMLASTRRLAQARVRVTMPWQP